MHWIFKGRNPETEQRRGDKATELLSSVRANQSRDQGGDGWLPGAKRGGGRRSSRGGRSSGNGSREHAGQKEKERRGRREREVRRRRRGYERIVDENKDTN